ncbi:MAG: hypothetical protein GTN76_05280 [Candidatus Aenigmarchaeota archaeon]|nr:hypothetical protein [Candidatus Aenigmarchaeota archaeon]
MNFQLLIFLANLILILVLFSLIIKHVKLGFKKIGRNTLIFIFLIFLVGLALRVPFEVQHIMTDEYAYMGVAKNILKRGEPSLCSYTDIETESCPMYLKPIMFSFILSLAFLIFGVSSLAAISVSVLFGSLSIILIFLLAYLLLRETEIGLWSALLLALNPIHIAWSKTAETSITSLFFIMLVFVIFFCYLRVRYNKVLLLGLFVTAFAVNMRPENIILLIMLIFLFYMFGRDLLKPEIKKIMNKKFWVWGAILIVMMIPYFTFLSDAMGGNKYLCSGDECYSQIFSLDTAKKNWEMYGLLSFFSYRFHPLIVSFLVLLSLLFIRKNFKEILFLWVYFLLFYTIFIMFNYLTSRHLLPLYLSLSVLAGFAIFQLNVYLKKYTKWFTFLIFLVLITASFYPYVLRTGNVNPFVALESALPEMLEKDISEECYVLAETPCIINSKTEIKTVSTGYALKNPQKLDNIIKNSKCTLFLVDWYYKNIFAFDRKENFDKINQTYDLNLYKEYSYDSVKFQLYNLSFKGL